MIVDFAQIGDLVFIGFKAVSKIVDNAQGQGENRFERRLSEHTRQYSSILNRFYTHLNLHKNGRVIPFTVKYSHWALDAFLK